jgi:hypothetical protein
VDAVQQMVLGNKMALLEVHIRDLNMKRVSSERAGGELQNAGKVWTGIYDAQFSIFNKKSRCLLEGF